MPQDKTYDHEHCEPMTTASAIDISVAFATTLDTPAHVELAEQLGFARAWLYDTPQQSPDVWMCLALAAQRTRSIGLGPGVLVPTLRHPMVNAAAAAALERIAPGRVAVGFGTGHTGRRAMGQPKPIPWNYMSRYVTVFRQLLDGQTVEWEGGALRMLHPAASSPPAPIRIPIYISAVGPRGIEVARRVADGLFVGAGVPDGASDFSAVAFLGFGTVLDENETATDDRVRAAAGPGLLQAFHYAYELGGPPGVMSFPGGKEWLAVVQRTPEAQRHFAVHRDHLMHLNEADVAAWSAGAHTLLTTATLSGRADEVRAKVEQLAANGVTELVYQPAGDIQRELETFAAAMELQRTGSRGRSGPAPNA
jgi:5,10-methylenetetrahydromethanopterin reductase